MNRKAQQVQKREKVKNRKITGRIYDDKGNYF